MQNQNKNPNDPNQKPIRDKSDKDLIISANSAFKKTAPIKDTHISQNDPYHLSNTSHFQSRGILTEDKAQGKTRQNLN